MVCLHQEPNQNSPRRPKRQTKNTQWITFPTLTSKYTHPHVANESVDFQVIPGKNCFVEFNKKFGFELLRTRDTDNKEVIQRIKKRKVDDISCGAIASSGGQISIGLTTGFIRLFNVQSSEYVPVKFKPDRMGNSVVGLDYSSTDEYLAAVYDSTDVNLFGLKTGIKTDTFRLPGISTLVRFHPVKKFALAIGSYEGAVTMLDIQTKKKLFFDKTAHDAPIRDISMYKTSEDLFVSCGYDCNINVFDLRKKSVVQQHKQSHPMSTVCVSSCGTFCVAGNLKGDVISYDFRNMQAPLDTKRLHDSAVVRVAFVPGITTASNLTFEQTANCTNFESFSTAAGSSRLSAGQDSFAKFVDVCHYNNVATTDVATPTRRDSWADLMPTKKPHDFSLDSMATPSQIWHSAGDAHSESILSVQSRLSLGQTDQNSVQRPVQVPEIRVSKPSERKEKSVIEPKRRRLTEKIALEGIEEEEAHEADGQSATVNKKWLHTVDHKEFANAFAAYVQKMREENYGDDEGCIESKLGQQAHAANEEDKENCQNNHQNHKSAIAESITNTPTRRTNTAHIENDTMITISTSELNETINGVLRQKLASLDMEFGNHYRKWQQNVTSYMDEKLHELTSQVRYMQGRYFHSDFNRRFINHMELEGELDILDEGLASLLHLDSVQTQYPVYATELEDLRKRFHDQQNSNRL